MRNSFERETSELCAFSGFWPTTFRAFDEAVPGVHLDPEFSSGKAAEPVSQRPSFFGVAFFFFFFFFNSFFHFLSPSFSSV